MLDTVKEHLNKPKSIQVDKNYWFASIMGLVFFAFTPLYFVCALSFRVITYDSLQLSVIVIFAISSILTLLFVYYLVTERRFKRINTNLYRAKNNMLLIQSFEDLGWNFLGGIHSYRIEESQSLLSPFGYVRFQAIPISNGVLYNVIYPGSSKARFPFFIGFKTYATWKFKRAMKNRISQNIA
jgi:hypothetical protein